MYRKQRVNPDNSWVIVELSHIFDHPIQDNSIMQEIVNTCISVCTVVLSL